MKDFKLRLKHYKHSSMIKKYDMISANIQENIKSHLQMRAEEFNRYFPEYNQTESKVDQKLICSPFSTNVALQKKSRKSSMNFKMRGLFVSESIEEFWGKKAISYTKIRGIVLCYLMLFSTNYANKDFLVCW